MLEISKKKLFVANLMYYSGIVFVLLYIVLSIMYGWPRALVFVFVVYMYVGANMRLNLFKCPSCGRRLFSGASRKAIRKLTPPSVCPDCETHIEIKYVE